MTEKKSPNVLRVVVVTDDHIVEDLHQTKPGNLDVGPGGQNDLNVYDAFAKPKDHQRFAPLQILVGGLLVIVGTAFFTHDVMSYARLVQDAELAGIVLTTAEATAQVGGFSFWSLLVAFAGLMPLIAGVTALQMAPPTVMTPVGDPGTRVAATHRLFRWNSKLGRYHLHIPRDAGGVIVVGDKKMQVQALRKHRGNSKGEVYVTLPPTAKGKLRMGQSTLVFQLTKPASVLSGMPFPKALIDYYQHLRMTRMELGVHMSAGVLLGGLFVMLSFQEATEPAPSDRYLDAMDLVRYEADTDDLDEDNEPEPEVKPEPTELDRAIEEHRTVKKKEVEVKPEPKDTKVYAMRPESFSKAAVEKARGVGVARVLGTYGGEGEGGVLDVISSTENDLGGLFAMGMTQTHNADAKSLTAFVAGGEGISAVGSVIDTEGLTTSSGPAKIERAKDKKKERKVKSKVKHTTDEVYGDVDTKLVKTVIRRRMGGLKACYERALRTNPALGGRMSISFDIAVIGRVTGVHIDKDTIGDAAVRACVEAKVKSWRFPVEGAEEPSEISFSVVFEH